MRAAIVDAMLTDASAGNPHILERVTASLRRPTKASMSLALRSFILDRADVTGLLPRIDVPALFVAGDDRGDWVPEDARRAAEATPRATAVTIAGARTLVPLEQPAACAAAIGEFWLTAAAQV